jgi:hypothetical protein
VIDTSENGTISLIILEFIPKKDPISVPMMVALKILLRKLTSINILKYIEARKDFNALHVRDVSLLISIYM